MDLVFGEKKDYKLDDLGSLWKYGEVWKEILESKKGWNKEKLSFLLDNKWLKPWKLNSSDYLESWYYPIIDQSKKKICWYSNNKDLLYWWKLPVIVYWDHTNIVKYIKIPFMSWADWTRILSFKSKLNVKYVYYFLQKFKPKSEWYRRHFALLKNVFVIIPSWKIQQKIVDILQSLDTAIENKQKKKDYLEKIKRKMMELLLTGKVRTLK